MSARLTRDGPLAVLTLDRPEALNALSFALLTEIGTRLEEVERSDARALIVTGAGPKAFCAGADIGELTGRSLIAERAGARLGQATFERLASLAIPSIAAINGFAFGGGLELALAATFRIAAPNAKLGLPEIKLGLIPGYGGTQRLPRLVGEGRALELIMTGRTVGAEEAERIGLVNRIADDALEGAKAFAGEFMSFGLPALTFAREAVSRALDLPIHEGLKVEADLSTLAYRTDDAREGLAAFIAKRQPVFRDG